MIGLAVLAALLAAQPRDVRAESQPSVASITGLPRRVALDTKRLFTTRTPALILAGGGVAALAVHPADHTVVSRLSSSSGLEDFLDAGATAGGGTVQGLTAVGVYAVGYAIRNERTKQVGTSLVEAQILNLFMTQGIKYAVNRERPDGGRYSFPSGHASATFVTADVLLQELGPKAGVPAYAGAIYVAISRLSETQHFPSDVVFGAAVGVACARTLDIRAHGHRFTVTPVPVPGGGAVFVQAVTQH
jgi:hypothetical protein